MSQSLCSTLGSAGCLCIFSLLYQGRFSNFSLLPALQGCCSLLGNCCLSLQLTLQSFCQLSSLLCSICSLLCIVSGLQVGPVLRLSDSSCFCLGLGSSSLLCTSDSSWSWVGLCRCILSSFFGKLSGSLSICLSCFGFAGCDSLC